MSIIILDFGSGNTCQNDKSIIKNMYDELKKIDNKKHEIIVKWQLFKEAGENIPLGKEIFKFAYEYGKNIGYQVTASVFDIESLNFLLEYDIPFVKIANNKELYYLIKHIPQNIPVYYSCNISYDLKIKYDRSNKLDERFYCISNYPAYPAHYELLRLKKHCNISDHTTSFELFKKYEPKIIEWHFMLENSTGLDAGEFARTPQQLKEIL